MCSNFGYTENLELTSQVIKERLDHVLAMGFRHVVLTGGEPTQHPSFWPLVARLHRECIDWSLITNGRSFCQAEHIAKVSEHRPRRALVSLHSHRPDRVFVLSGGQQNAFFETTKGISALVETQIDVTINCVLTKLNIGELKEYLLFCQQTFGSRCPLIFTFPSLYSKGMDWDMAQLTFGEVGPILGTVRDCAEQLGLKLYFQNIPPCILGDKDLSMLNRSAFGISHYLDEEDGRSIYSIEYAEAQMTAYSLECEKCIAFDTCPGVEQIYLARHGTAELSQFFDYS